MFISMYEMIPLLTIKACQLPGIGCALLLYFSWLSGEGVLIQGRPSLGPEVSCCPVLYPSDVELESDYLDWSTRDETLSAEECPGVQGRSCCLLDIAQEVQWVHVLH